MRILVVDDYPGFARSLKLLLSHQHEVLLSGGGEEALDLLSRDDRFDLILADVGMPVVSGLDVYQRLADGGSPLARRVVFMTGGSVGERERALLATGQRTLQKPFSEGDLNRILAELASS